jgi:hypothetical protein
VDGEEGHPDQWQVTYNVTKRRAGKAPEGSGVPVGTAYHWYILAHQNVTKLNANDYSTSMIGMKFKLAHLRADKGRWSASTEAQRRNLIKILKQVTKDLEREAAAECEGCFPQDRARARAEAAPETGSTRAPPDVRRSSRRPVDVVIVGAGAAGLAAAPRAAGSRSVDRHPRSARPRRWPHPDPSRSAVSRCPIELGAEFVHGDAPITEELLRRAGSSTLHIGGERRARPGER